MRHRIIILALLCTSSLYGCDALMGPKEPRLMVAPRDTVVDVGARFQFRVGPDGSAPGSDVTWTILDPQIARFSLNSIEALRPGTVRIVARLGQREDTVRLTVRQTLARIEPVQHWLILSPGGSARITARGVDTEGQTMLGSAFTWRSSNEAVATVTPDGDVLAIAYGEADLHVRAGSVENSVRVAVYPPQSTACDDPGSRLRLDFGDVAVFRGAAAERICLSSGETYVITPLLDGPPASRLDLDVLVPYSGIYGIAGAAPAALSPVQPTSASFSTAEDAFRDLTDEYHHHLRALEEQQLGKYLGGSGDPRPAAAGSVAPLSLDDVFPLRFPRGCDSWVETGARVVAIDGRVIIAADTLNPPLPPNAISWTSMARSLNTVFYPLAVARFGEPSDIDGENAVILFVTRSINELATSDGYVAGMFFSGDLFPRQQCGASNQREVLYMLAPDPNGVVENVRWPASEIASMAGGIFIHEMQHLINASRRIFVNNAPVWETTWLNEGLSHIAEELAFYRVSGLPQRQNLNQLAISTRFNQFVYLAGDNLLNYARYLQIAPTVSPFDAGSGTALRGAIWSLLRYSADMAEMTQPGSEQTLWFNLANSTIAGGTNLEANFGVSQSELLRRWILSVAMDDRVLDDGSLTSRLARLQQPSWNWTNLSYHYRLPPNVQETYLVSGSHRFVLRGSTGLFLRSDAREVGFRVGDGPPPQSFVVSITRLN